MAFSPKRGFLAMSLGLTGPAWTPPTHRLFQLAYGNPFSPGELGWHILGAHVGSRVGQVLQSYIVVMQDPTLMPTIEVAEHVTGRGRDLEFHGFLASRHGNTKRSASLSQLLLTTQILSGYSPRAFSRFLTVVALIPARSAMCLAPKPT